jgi:hypothetical protein
MVVCGVSCTECHCAEKVHFREGACFILFGSFEAV